MTEDSHPSPDEAHFTFDGNFVLTEKELWPDGDAPFQWTAVDVEALIEKGGGLGCILSSWFIGDSLVMQIWVNGETVNVYG